VSARGEAVPFEGPAVPVDSDGEQGWRCMLRALVSAYVACRVLEHVWYARADHRGERVMLTSFTE